MKTAETDPGRRARLADTFGRVQTVEHVECENAEAHQIGLGFAYVTLQVVQRPAVGKTVEYLRLHAGRIAHISADIEQSEFLAKLPALLDFRRNIGFNVMVLRGYDKKDRNHRCAL